MGEPSWVTEPSDQKLPSQTTAEGESRPAPKIQHPNGNNNYIMCRPYIYVIHLYLLSKGKSMDLLEIYNPDDPVALLLFIIHVDPIMHVLNRE